MRERWARRLALFTGLCLAAIAAALAGWHNHSPRAPGIGNGASADQAPAPIAAELTERGAALFREQGCRRCHSSAGDGVVRNPLDGIGSRRDAAQLRAWIIADASVAGAMSARTQRVKQDYAQLPSGELDALVAYLQSLPAR